MNRLFIELSKDNNETLSNLNSPALIVLAESCVLVKPFFIGDDLFIKYAGGLTPHSNIFIFPKRSIKLIGYSIFNSILIEDNVSPSFIF